MNFKTKSKKVPHLSVVLLLGTTILFFLNLYNLCIINDLHSYMGIIFSLLIAISQALKIKKYNKEKNLDSL